MPQADIDTEAVGLDWGLNLGERYMLHPNYLVRVAGEPARLLELTRTGKTAVELQRRVSLMAEVSARSDEGCAILETKVRGLADKKLSRGVLKLKRNIYNSRGSSQELVSLVATLLDADETSFIRKLNDDVVEFHSMSVAISEAYVQEDMQTRVQLHELWERQNFQLGMSYSNPKLFADLSRFFADPNKKIKAKKRRQLEEALVQYASRCAVKTSPLSTFTPVFVGEWRKSTVQNDIQMEFDPQIRNVGEYKSGLLQSIIETFLKNYDLVRPRFGLMLNPSLVVDGEELQFRKVTSGDSINGRVWGAGESVSRLKANKVMQLIIYAFSQMPATSASADDIAKLASKLAPQLTLDQLDGFVRKLFDIELIQPAVERYAQTDILDWAEGLFTNDETALGREAVRCMGGIRTQLQTFGQATPTHRLDIDQAIRDSTSELIELFSADPPELVRKAPFFENSYLTSIHNECSTDLLDDMADELALLTDLSPMFDFNHYTQSDLADYFISQFGEDGVCTEPEAMIQEFDRIYGVSQIGFTPATDEFAPRSEVRSEHAAIVAEFNVYLTDCLISDKAEVALDAKIVRNMLDRLPGAINRRQISHSFVGQFSTNEGQNKFVINQVFGGHSGLLSRFLETLNDTQLDQVKDYLSCASTDGTYAEVPGVFGFNANRHPRMTDKELEFPPFSCNWADTTKLRLSDLELVLNKETHRVHLRQPDGKLLDVFYHGFLIPFLIPSLQKIFATLGMNGTMVYILQALRSGRLIRAGEITPLPRISLGNVVLIRRSWLVPRELLPLASMSALDFFDALYSWAIDNDLPPDAFVRVSPFEAAGGEDQDWANMDFKNMKPFYVRFDNPRLVQLLQRALNRNDYPIVVSEALPNVNDQHVVMDGERHVAEIQFELTRKKADASNPVP